MGKTSSVVALPVKGNKSMSFRAASWVRQTLAQYLGKTHGGARDLYAQFGYPQQIETRVLYAMYLRNAIANRAVHAFPKATWRDPPVLRDEEGDSYEEDTENYSPFAHACYKFMKNKRAWHYLERADRLAGIGEYGILVLGFADNLPFDAPMTTQAKLIYMQAYPQVNADISTIDLNEKSERYGKPTIYNVQTQSSMTGQSTQSRSLRVHWTRCFHLAEVKDGNEVFGTPRLLPIYNNLQDLEKVLGGGAETYWLNARPGLALEADPEAQMTADDLADMQTQTDEWEHQLRRVIAFQGVKATQLQAAIADPKSNIEGLLDVISGGLGIPKRILIGSERGELASSQDENNWNNRIDERRGTYATPMILQPFVQRMIETGNLPEPKGDWDADWPEASALAPDAEADIGVKKAQALSSYCMTPGAELVMPVQEFRRDILGIAPESEYSAEEVPGLGPEEAPLDETDEGVDEQFNMRHNYDDDQPRDDDGKWGEGGGGSAGSDPDDDVAAAAIEKAHSSMFARSQPTPPSKATKNAIDKYTSNGYLGINQSLRDGGEIDAKTAKQIGHMDKLFEGAGLAQPMTAYRTVSGDFAEALEAHEGKTFTDWGFVSMTATKGEGLVGGKGKVAVRMEIPKGAKALPIAHMSGNPFEQEILGARNSRFKVGRDKDGIVLTMLKEGE